MSAFQPSRLGPTGTLWSTLDLMRARCRDEVRNNPWAASAVDNFESQVIGNGIRPYWNLDDQDLKRTIEAAWKRWATANSFYALQATAAREVFEAGEVFCRFHLRPPSWNLPVPLELELIEGEQVPVFLSSISGGGGGAGTPRENSIRTGIEFDPSKRITAYHMYREHPGETMFYPMDGLTFIRVPAAEVLHVFKRQRAGLLRGQPHLGAVLVALHEIGKYTDAAVVKKQIQTMFAGFVEKADPASDILPVDTTAGDGSAGGNSFNPPYPYTPPLSYDPLVESSGIETGTLQYLLPNEKITFPSLPQDNDIETFLSVCLHQFAVGIGATYEQITGDLRGVNLSSIRAGILDFRRKCEQFQRNVIVSQLIYPVVRRWMYEAVMAGELKLPGYGPDPSSRSLYENIDWGLPGWPWIDPLKDAMAKQMEVRSGFTSREAVVAEKGDEVAEVDRQQTIDNARTDTLKLVYDSDGRRVMPKGSKLTADAEEMTGGVANDTTNPEPLPGSKPGKSGKSDAESE